MTEWHMADWVFFHIMGVFIFTVGFLIARSIWKEKK